MATFVLLHVPAFALVIAWAASTNARTRVRARLFIGVFLIVHAVLHTLNRHHPGYEFSSMLSHLLIYGGGACGAVYLGLEGGALWRARSS
jgi:hypothetical protein